MADHLGVEPVKAQGVDAPGKFQGKAWRDGLGGCDDRFLPAVGSSLRGIAGKTFNQCEMI